MGEGYTFEELILALILMEPQNLTIPPDFVQQEYDLSDLIYTATVAEHTEYLNSLVGTVADRSEPMPTTGGMCEFCPIQQGISQEFFGQNRAMVEIVPGHYVLGVLTQEGWRYRDTSGIGDWHGVDPNALLTLEQYAETTGWTDLAPRILSIEEVQDFYDQWENGLGGVGLP